MPRRKKFTAEQIIARSGKASGSQQEHPAVRRIASSSEATSRSDVPAA
jgi:hypothetical protein